MSELNKRIWWSRYVLLNGTSTKHPRIFTFAHSEQHIDIDR